MSQDQDPSPFQEEATVRDRLSELERKLRGPAQDANSGSPAASAPVALVAPRPLLELFPPAVGRGRARPASGAARPERPIEGQAPALAGAPPPRINRSRFALQADRAAQAPPEPLTYEPFYGFDEDPFSLSRTDSKFIYHTASRDRVLQELADALGRGAGIMLLTGIPGVGKTTLCHSLVEQLGRRTVTSFVADHPASFDDLLRTALVDYGCVSREDAARGQMAAATRDDLLAAIGDFAASLAPLHASAVIVLDDAHDAGAEVLEPIAVLAHAADPDRRVQIILAGEPAVSGALRSRTLRPLDSQIALRCQLVPLTADEVAGYVAHRVARAGTSPRLEFDEAAIARLHAVTGGIPRLINDVCHVALTLGQQVSASVIDEDLVVAAAADLELVPARFGSRRMARTALGPFVLFLLMLAGAALAAWVFQGRFAQLLGR